MSTKKENKTFDTPNHSIAYTHIIVGGESADAVIASRLSENAAFNILLIEAGRAFVEDLISRIIRQ
ncbi:GMC family oxidoreductase N-terminal domain-containing protein [Sphingobacterium sp. SYP-B4668]|uniref:GMC family oxidoreductase N-terminal domain-containing protein n=1 Tax=Sphingobacterium sp. SYP-B4668 TaxID=2996035 RepID=UPI0022DDC8E6|nr:GMC family oxidoreductase N-terminal domain-containing protein [Sphingobacterium sp. SYP-B4668]